MTTLMTTREFRIILVATTLGATHAAAEPSQLAASDPEDSSTVHSEARPVDAVAAPALPEDVLRAPTGLVDPAIEQA